MRRYLFLLAIFWCAQIFAEPAALPEPLARSLQRHGLSTRGLSIYVHEVGSVAPLLMWAADEPRSPASVMKLLPTLAALEELGPAFQWKTELWTTATLREGQLNGDIYIKGNGDPWLVIEHFWRLLRRLREEGVSSISGDLVIDQSYFIPDAEEPGDFDGRPQRAYNVLPTALLVNFQAVNFRFIPDPATDRLRLLAEPWPAQLQLENKVRLTHEACRGGWMQNLSMRTTRKGQQDAVVFSGSYDVACGERQMFRVVSDSAPYIRGVFKSVWNEMGGQFDGAVREATVPDDARLLASLDSVPLSEAIRSVNKFSNNVMTRQLLLTLGAQQSSPPGTVENGIAAVRTWMTKRGFNFPELVLENATGLSRKERISARHLGEILLAGYTSPVMPEFMSSFPLAGVDGTLRHRMVGTVLAGRAHLKTGAINNVHSVAGYVLDQFNRRVVVVVLHNHPQANSAAADAFQDAVLDWVYRRPR